MGDEPETGYMPWPGFEHETSCCAGEKKNLKYNYLEMTTAKKYILWCKEFWFGETLNGKNANLGN